MSRLTFLGSATLIVAACASLPACGQQDASQKIVAQCSDPAPDMLDSCLEQVRVQQETDPSPEMDQLLAKLIRRQVEVRNPPQEAPPDGNGADTDNLALPPPSPDLGSADSGAPGPDMSRDDIAPPAQAGGSTDAGPDDADGPPAQLPGPADMQNSPPNGGGPGEGAI